MDVLWSIEKQIGDTHVHPCCWSCPPYWRTYTDRSCCLDSMTVGDGDSNGRSGGSSSVDYMHGNIRKPISTTVRFRTVMHRMIEAVTCRTSTLTSFAFIPHTVRSLILYVREPGCTNQSSVTMHRLSSMCA